MIAKNKRPAKFLLKLILVVKKCGRPHSVYRKFKLCRVCFRELAYKGQIPGVTKHLGNLRYQGRQNSKVKIGT